MLILYAILVVSASLSALTDASAIKGHARAHEDSRSIKLAPASNNIDKLAKGVSPVQASVPILESTKRIYNDESIRRSVVAAPPAPVAAVEHQIKPIEQVVVAAPQKAPEQPINVVAAPVQPVPVVANAPVVVAKPEPVSVAAVPQPQAEQPVQPSSPIEAKSDKPVPVVVSQPAKPAAVDELPAQSDRSAPIRQEVPVIQPVQQPSSSVVITEQLVRAPVVEQPVVAPVVVPVAAPVVAPVAAPVVPVVVVKEESVPVVEPVVVKESVLQAKKEEVVPAEVPIEVPAPDPGLILSEPIDSTTKLLIDLDEHVQKFLPAEEQQLPVPHKDQSLVAGVDYSPAAAQAADPTGKSAPLAPYSSVGAEEPIVPPLPSLDGVEKASAGQPASGVAASPSSSSSSSSSSSATSSATRQGNGQHQNQQQVITQLLDQLDTLQTRIQDTINQLVARRRYVMSALLRPMGTYVRRVRTNLERLQNRVNQLQAAAVSVGGGQNRPGGFVDQAAIETIRRRIDDISKRISDIVNRIRFSLTPTSAPLNSNGRK